MDKFGNFLTLGLLVLVSACASGPAPQAAAPASEKTVRATIRDEIGNLFDEDYADTRAVDILYVTNREAANKTDLNFGATLGKEVLYGQTKVNVPKRHAVGAIEATSNPREDTHRFYRIMQNKPLTAAEWSDSVKVAKKWGVLVFVHGFNVKYEDAVMRTAQIAYDLKFQGKIVLWSWPAGAGQGFLDGRMINRTYDQNRKNAQASVEAFSEFVKSLSGLNIPVQVMVHSMGHQVVIPALQAVADQIGKPVIDELILNAPDIDSRQFETAVPYLKKICHRITLYCSYNDNAIYASEALNGGIRMGACAHIDGVDVVNVSEIDDPGLRGLGHGYYSSRPILTDVFQVLLGIDAEKRLFMRKSEPNATENFILRP